VPVTAGATTNLGMMTTLAPSSGLYVSGAVTVAGWLAPLTWLAEQTVTSSGRTYEIASTSTTSGPYSNPAGLGLVLLGTITTLAARLRLQLCWSDVGIYDVTPQRDAAGSSAFAGVTRQQWTTVVGFILSP